MVTRPMGSICAFSLSHAEASAGAAQVARLPLEPLAIISGQQHDVTVAPLKRKQRAGRRWSAANKWPYLTSAILLRQRVGLWRIVRAPTGPSAKGARLEIKEANGSAGSSDWRTSARLQRCNFSNMKYRHQSGGLWRESRSQPSRCVMNFARPLLRTGDELAPL